MTTRSDQLPAGADFATGLWLLNCQPGTVVTPTPPVEGVLPCTKTNWDTWLQVGTADPHTVQGMLADSPTWEQLLPKRTYLAMADQADHLFSKIDQMRQHATAAFNRGAMERTPWLAVMTASGLSEATAEAIARGDCPRCLGGGLVAVAPHYDTTCPTCGGSGVAA